jgi:bacterioferritin
MATRTMGKRSNGVRAQVRRDRRSDGDPAAREAGRGDRQGGAARARLVRDLNEDLAGELSAIIQYITYAAKVTGPYRPELSAFFLKEVPDEQGHAQFLANKIVALGGEPVTTPRPVPPASSNREMLVAVLEAERRARADYTERARQAEVFGDKGLQVMLENIVADETGHFEETERMLMEWPDR